MAFRHHVHRLVTRMLPASLATALQFRGHARRARTEQATSFAGESEFLDLVFATLGITGGVVVDIAAGDGVAQSCTLPLFRNPRWSGLAVECDPEKFARLAYAYRQFSGVQLAQAMVTPDTVCELLRAFDVPTAFEFLNLDIDSYDLFVADALLRQFRPRVISMEVNEKIPPPIVFAVCYDRGFTWDNGPCYGCSITAAAACLTRHGYGLIGLQYNNAVFVRADAMGSLPAVTVERAYRTGYRDRPDRLALFPWNAVMEDLLTMPPADAVQAIDERFASHRGEYILSLDSDIHEMLGPHVTAGTD